MNKLLILSGPPGSGKSTFAKSLVETSGDKGEWVIVSRDAIRYALRGNYNMGNNIEGIVTSIQHDMIEHALLKFNVVLDNTHVDAKTIKSVADLYYRKAKISVMYFQNDENGEKLTLDRLKAINKTRDKKVPEEVVEKMYSRFTHTVSPKSESNTYAHIKNLRDSLTVEPSESGNPDLPDCIIVDIDGTVAIHGNRSPYEYNKVYEDTVNLPVLYTIAALQGVGFKIIFLSGRDSVCREDTVKWLADKMNFIVGENCELYMREQKDFRKDAIIKREIYERDIKPRYNVALAIDDRDSIVDLWRNKLDIPCFQVDYGNF